jgi:hypothetical protein
MTYVQTPMTTFPPAQELLPFDGSARLAKLFAPGEAAAYFSSLRAGLGWREEVGRSRRGKYTQPRPTAFFGPGPYNYSGVTHEAQVVPPALAELFGVVRGVVGRDFNACLANLYRTGRDHVGMHADNERVIVAGSPIVSVSFDSPRRFVMAHLETREKVEVSLEPGDLLIMNAVMQQYWQHGVPATKRFVGERINLTFRVHCEPSR